MSMHEPQEKPTRGFKLFSVVYFLILVAVAFFLSGLAMEQGDIYKRLNLHTITIPVLKKPASDIPEIAIQLVLAAIIFFVLQFVTVFVISIFKKEEDEYDRLYREQTRR